MIKPCDYVFAGDSWAVKGHTEQNYNRHHDIAVPGDVRLADFWPWKYDYCFARGKGNLTCMERLKQKNIPSDVPIIWIFTEPGRDYHIITGRSEFEWMESEQIFEIRKMLEKEIFERIHNELKNPIGFIGGLSDINIDLSMYPNFTVLHPSWQKWIATRLNSKWFKFGWGACDIGWRANYDNVKPGKQATFAWDEQIKEWCWWEEQGYFCHEHPTILANQEFAEYLHPTVQQWLEIQNEQR